MTKKRKTDTENRAERRDKQIGYRVTPSEYVRIRKFADKRGLTFIGLIELALEAYIDRADKK